VSGEELDEPSGDKIDYKDVMDEDASNETDDEDFLEQSLVEALTAHGSEVQGLVGLDKRVWSLRQEQDDGEEDEDGEDELEMYGEGQDEEEDNEDESWE
jgi:hypothetical protein